MAVTDRMTDRSRKVLSLAEQAARWLGYDEVQPEHILLGLALEGGGVAWYVLRDLNADAKHIRHHLSETVAAQLSVSQERPLSAAALRTIERAYDEAKLLNHAYIGTEHLILGVALAGEGSVPEILSKLHLTAKVIRREVYCLLGHELPNVPAS